MANLDHDAIRKAYSEVTTIQDSIGAFDKDGNSVILDQSKIDAARVELNNEYNHEAGVVFYEPFDVKNAQVLEDY